MQAGDPPRWSHTSPPSARNPRARPSPGTKPLQRPWNGVFEPGSGRRGGGEAPRARSSGKTSGAAADRRTKVSGCGAMPRLGRPCAGALLLLKRALRCYAEGVMARAKSKVREMLDRLPDDCSLEDVLYHLHVVREVEKGLQDAGEKRVLSAEQVEEGLRRRWQVGRAG